jgi:peptidoglycan hydrolase-like protein with peptidoglycan-binding domain
MGRLVLVLVLAGCGFYMLLPASEYSSGVAASSSANSPAPRRAACPPLLHRGHTDPINGTDCVSRLQTALQRLDYDQQVNGRFDPQTEANVRNFQQRHNIDPTNGRAGPTTQIVLRLTAAPAPPDLAGCPPLHLDQHDPINGRYCITTLQWALQHYWPDQIINGHYRAQTRENVGKIQKRHHIVPMNGKAGPITRTVLRLAAGAPPSLADCLPPQQGQRDPINGRYCITTLQWALQHVENPNQEISGHFDRQTEANVSNFQQRYDIPPPRGVVGPRTKAALLSGEPPPTSPASKPQPSDDRQSYCQDGACHYYLDRSATWRYAQELDKHPVADSVSKSAALIAACQVLRVFTYGKFCMIIAFLGDAVAETIENRLNKAAQQHACLHLSVGRLSTGSGRRLLEAEPDNSPHCSD